MILTMSTIQTKINQDTNNYEISTHMKKALKKTNKKIPRVRPIILKIKKIKDKERILKEASGKKHLNYRGIKIRITSDFSETMYAREME